MKEDRENNKNKINASLNNSKKRNKTLSKKEMSEIDSSLLLDQILAKKKVKKNKTEKYTLDRKQPTTKKRNLSKVENKKSNDEIDGSLLLEEILAKKKAKKEKLEQLKLEKTGKAVDKELVNNNLVKEILIDDKKEESLKDQKEDSINKKEENEIKEIESEKKTIYDYEKENNPLSDVDSAESLEIKQSELNVEHKKNKINTKLLFFSLLILFSLVLILVVSLKISGENKNLIKNNKEKVEELALEEKKKKEQEEKYNNCLNLSFNDKDSSEEINNYINELNNYLSNYSVSLIYEDLERGYTFSYNKDVVYYAASTIKSLDALYIYQKAYNNELSLDETITYTKEFKWGASKFMSTHKYGDKITLRELVKYAIIVSDNSAHQMLVKYIGYSNLKNFGQSLGAQYTLTSGDNFGNISATDGIIYMKAIYNFISNSGELGQELKSYFIAAEQNDLALPELNILAMHKYGQYSYFYHDIGVVYAEHPYVMAILTKEGNKDFENIVKDINKHIYKLHTLYNENRNSYCKNLVYGN